MSADGTNFTLVHSTILRDLPSVISVGIGTGPVPNTKIVLAAATPETSYCKVSTGTVLDFSVGIPPCARNFCRWQFSHTQKSITSVDRGTALTNHGRLHWTDGQFLKKMVSLYNLVLADNDTTMVRIEYVRQMIDTNYFRTCNRSYIESLSSC